MLKSVPKKHTIPLHSSKAQTHTSGFFSQNQSVKASQSSIVIPVDSTTEEGDIVRTLKTQKLKDVEEEQLEDSAPNTNRGGVTAD